ncbi:uncharacterized protein L969DRAFT_84188 [Mixia osmundae IAM 14324]|uniref:uncharacterized protein n=1 Tax=Mixia osmundae (strain CBS 9802 / IAM 14324 / JCM 22182 / KY 12970) TaxID=764103 RepID=UPI0004A553B2|nr:uncharacterized protein L969DRAFT_84188 [Mixia osmundae IAM 14324]KEI42330.1 hypothetical protein L969DRAFT_84188 [Mixia osmundae IAM 14324]
MLPACTCSARVSHRAIQRAASTRLTDGPLTRLQVRRTSSKDTPRVVPQTVRQLHASARSQSTYDDFVNVLSDAPRPAIIVETASEEKGFMLSDGLTLPQACIFLNGSTFLWDVPEAPQDFTWQDWSIDHFKIFEVVSPRPEILFLGTGAKTAPSPPWLRKYMTHLGIQLDVLDSASALSLPASIHG